MTRQFDALQTVGLRHVLQDGLAILTGSTLEPERAKYVLSDLATMISNAKQCSEQQQSHNWFVGAPNREALEIVSLMERHLEDTGTAWRAWLDSAALVFERLKNNEDIAEQPKRDTIAFLEQVLSCLANQAQLTRASSPFEETLNFRP